MAKSEVVTLRISEDIKKKLKKVFGEEVTTSDIIRSTIETYLNKIEKAEKGIVQIELPINLLKGESLRDLYNDICKLEEKTIEEIVNLGYDYDLEYLESIQRTKKLIVAHLSIDKDSKELAKETESLIKQSKKMMNK